MAEPVAWSHRRLMRRRGSLAGRGGGLVRYLGLHPRWLPPLWGRSARLSRSGVR